MPGNRRTHFQQFAISLSIVEQIPGDHHVKRFVKSEPFDILNQIVDSQPVGLFLTERQLNHPVGYIDSDHSRSAAALDEPRVKSFPTRQVENRLAAQISEQLEERKMLNTQTPRLLFGAFVFFSDLVVVRRHESSLLKLALDNATGLFYDLIQDNVDIFPHPWGIRFSGQISGLARDRVAVLVFSVVPNLP